MRPLTSILALLLATALAPGQTNDPAATARCLARMEAFLEQLAELEGAISNDTARAECITSKRNKIKGLRELTAAAAARLPVLDPDDDADAIAAEQSAITIACARADKLAAEAADCQFGPSAKPRKNRTASAPPPPVPRRSSTPSRDETSCLKQAQFAQLLVKAMDLGKPTTNATEELARFAIEPLRGWKPAECATLDDLCVAVARALNLKVETPADPVSYQQALRYEGLPVDSCFPRRLEGADPPLLLEVEVRTFFAKGYAAPLPSSRPLTPD